MGNGPKSWAIVDSLRKTIEHLQLNFEDDEIHPPDQKTPQKFVHRITFLGRPKSWTDSEERRRLFWNVFLLDRFCSISRGSKPSLTCADARRRLPCENSIWEVEKSVRTRYFGIQDMEISDFSDSSISAEETTEEVKFLGAFAYCIEATEFLVSSCSKFLQLVLIVDVSI